MPTPIDKLPTHFTVTLDDDTSMEFVLIQPGDAYVGQVFQPSATPPLWLGWSLLSAGITLASVVIYLSTKRWFMTRRWQLSIRACVAFVLGICMTLGGSNLIRYCQLVRFQERLLSHVAPEHTLTPQVCKIRRPFYIAKYEVSNEQFAALGTRRALKRTWNDPRQAAGELTWRNASDFCEELSAVTGKRCRLPTEIEWEYACRAGTQSLWHNGSDPRELGNVAWCGGVELRPRAPGLKAPNRWGLHDMHGNVREWCLPASDDSVYVGPQAATNRIARGGDFNSGARHCMSAYRTFWPDDWFDYSSGFRPVMETN